MAIDEMDQQRSLRKPTGGEVGEAMDIDAVLVTDPPRRPNTLTSTAVRLQEVT
jgi:tRNA (Thr-GGU) A37 N-methylase